MRLAMAAAVWGRARTGAPTGSFLAAHSSHVTSQSACLSKKATDATDEAFSAIILVRKWLAMPKRAGVLVIASATRVTVIMTKMLATTTPAEMGWTSAANVIPHTVPIIGVKSKRITMLVSSDKLPVPGS